jgi:hypothetical protein
MKNPKPLLGLLHRRELVVPTWKGWLALLLTVSIIGFAVARSAYDFLALHDPQPGEILVIEGWSPEFTIAEGLAEYQRTKYQELIVTGGPIELGNSLIDFKTYAELGTAVLTVRKWLHERGLKPAKINIIGNGSHARRTRLVYQMAFGDEAKVGICTSPEKDFDPRRWWTTSQGFKAIMGEIIAYTYTRLFFSPPKS